jgi:phosphoribosyl-dephospho-CoA transferase
MVALHRHQLVRLRQEAWGRLQQEAVESETQAALQCWREGGFPLVVCRQPCRAPEDGAVAVGLAAPLAWQRRRWLFSVRRDEVLYFDEFPPAVEIAALLSRRARPGWTALCDDLRRLGLRVRVYGSHGWQRLTGLPYLRAGSDLDLCLPVQDAEQADQVVQCLSAAPFALPRLDGELLFPDGGGVAWREWQAWRNGCVREVLVKRLHGVELTAQPLCEAMA